jgi:hypothetical protein
MDRDWNHSANPGCECVGVVRYGRLGLVSERKKAK